jgi:hypothetical protein
LESAGEQTFVDANSLGTPMTVKVHVVQMVSPGLYPILKPAETRLLTSARMQEWETIHKLFPGEQHISVPTPPLTNIAFNTYEIVVAEGVTPQGDTPLNFARYTNVQSKVNPYPIPPTVSPQNANPFEPFGDHVGNAITDQAIRNNIAEMTLEWVEEDQQIAAQVTIRTAFPDRTAAEAAIKTAIRNIIRTNSGLSRFAAITDENITIDFQK